MAAAFRFGREAGPTAHTSLPQREIPSARSIHPREPGRAEERCVDANKGTKPPAPHHCVVGCEWLECAISRPRSAASRQRYPGAGNGARVISTAHVPNLAPLKRGSALPSTNPRHRQRPKAPRPQGPMGANSAAHHPSPPDDAVPWNNGRPSVSGSDAGRYFLYQCNLGNVRSATSQRTDSHTVPPPVQPRRRSRDCDTQHWIPGCSSEREREPLSVPSWQFPAERARPDGRACCLCWGGGTVIHS